MNLFHIMAILISPTVPIAVLGILKSACATKSLETKITGESLFNNGIAVVVFLVLLSIAASGHDVSAGTSIRLFLQEAVGGVAFSILIQGRSIGPLVRYARSR